MDSILTFLAFEAQQDPQSRKKWRLWETFNKINNVIICSLNDSADCLEISK